MDYATMGVCSVDGCDKPRRCRRYCDNHYYRFKRYRDPLGKPPEDYRRHPFEPRFWAKVAKSDEGCWLWTAGIAGQRAYGSFLLSPGQRVYAHRLSYEMHYGPIPDGMWVLHRCDTPRCVRPDHLFLGTHQDNMNDMAAKGRGASGERSGAKTHPEAILRGTQRSLAKLNEVGVRDIRHQLMARTASQPALAAKYGVSRSLISAIARGKCWVHVR